MWRPGLSLFSFIGELQRLKACLSRLHWKAAPGVSEAKLNLAVFFFDFFFGPLEIVVSSALAPPPGPNVGLDGLAMNETPLPLSDAACGESGALSVNSKLRGLGSWAVW